MNKSLIASIKSHMEEKETEELKNIWIENDRERYSDEAYEAIKELLIERGVDPPEQKDHALEEIKNYQFEVKRHKIRKFYILSNFIATVIIGVIFPIIWFSGMGESIGYNIGLSDTAVVVIGIVAIITGLGGIIFTIVRTRYFVDVTQEGINIENKIIIPYDKIVGLDEQKTPSGRTEIIIHYKTDYTAEPIKAKILAQISDPGNIAKALLKKLATMDE